MLMRSPRQSGLRSGSSALMSRTVSGRSADAGPAINREIMLRAGRRLSESALCPSPTESDARVVSDTVFATGNRRSTHTSGVTVGVQLETSGAPARQARLAAPSMAMARRFRLIVRRVDGNIPCPSSRARRTPRSE